MILSTQNITENFSNGNLSYLETRAIVHDDWISFYPNLRKLSDGSFMIRLNKNVKYNIDGSIQWQLNYDEFGNLIK